MKEEMKNKTPELVVELLKTAVEMKGQSGVARETGLTQSAIHRYLKGIGEPSTRTMQRLADYFGVSVWHLRGESGGFFWVKEIDITDKILNISITHFNSLIENDYRTIGEFFYIGVVLSLATLTLEIPAAASTKEKSESILMVHKMAKEVIEKYGKYFKARMQELNNDEEQPAKDSSQDHKPKRKASNKKAKP